MTHIARVARPTSSSTRSRISAAALFVNVIARISLGAGLVGAQQVRDPVREHAGLARAGAGQDQQRALAVGDGVALGRVQAFEEVVDGGVGGHRIGR